MKRLFSLGILTLAILLGPGSSLSQAQEDARRNLEVGSVFFIKGEYENSIPPYRRALEQEKVKQTLPRDLWRVLIDNLGMAYGITGDLKKAKETFEYGLSKDPKYPMFHYNMACTYAEMDDMDKAIDYLRNAFEYRANMIKGERFPDPARDSSFSKFMKNEKFRSALKEMTR